MSGPTKLHDLGQVVLTIGGYLIEGYGEGEAISIEPVAEVTTSSVGADGQPTYARSNDKRAKVTITVRQNSLAHRNLGTLLAAQEAAPRLTPLPFLLVDSLTGERMSSAYFVFTGRPTVAQAANPSNRVYVGELPNGFELGNYDPAPLVAV